MSSPVHVRSKFVTFLTQRSTFVDEFNQPSCVTMQVFAGPGPRHGFITFGTMERSDEGIWSPYAKFEVEEASSGPPNAVHLKSSYNQKYLRLDSEAGISIAAAGDEPEEDISKWSCTLFSIFDDRSVRIHYSGHSWLVRGEVESEGEEIIWARVVNGRLRPTSFTIPFHGYDPFDLDMLPTLPTHVCFKADNNRYLRMVSGSQARFTCPDRREREAQFEVVRTRLRSVALRPVAFPNSYLVRQPNADHYGASDRNLQNALLEPIVLNIAGPAAVAFKSLAHPNNNFIVRRLTDDAFAVAPGQTGIVAQAEFLTEETVRSRQLSMIQFMYDDMKILDPTPVAVVTKNVVNRSKVSTQEGHVSFKYSEYQSSHWETTHSWQVGVSWGSVTTISARMPVLKFIKAETTVSVGLEAGYQGEHVAGETKEEESEMTTSLTIQVPPNTESLVNMVVSRAKILLPFTYTQREMLHDGSLVSTKKSDGLYEGEATHVDYQIEEQSL